MFWYIRQYVSTCNLCLQIKPIQYTLLVLEIQWNTLSIDFIVELPKLSRHDVVMTVVDSVLKKVYFILTYTTVTVEGAVRLFLHYIQKLHGLPRQVVSDQSLQSVILFIQKLYRLLGIRLASSTAWHPQCCCLVMKTYRPLEVSIQEELNRVPCWIFVLRALNRKRFPRI